MAKKYINDLFRVSPNNGQRFAAKGIITFLNLPCLFMISRSSVIKREEGVNNNEFIERSNNTATT